MSETARLRLRVLGAVQGVGFRPFVFRLATELKLAGAVSNSPAGVSIEVEGTRAALESFLLRLETERPPLSFIQSLEATWLDAVGLAEFRIEASAQSGPRRALVLPDIATCPDCLRDILDPANRRFRYPFTNCTQCGPRFSIIESLPYDRARTSMKGFAMCPECQREYHDPGDRRFHAQPNACPVCGPELALWDTAGGIVSKQDAALLEAAEALRQGQIVAVKGLGGFHLLAIAHDESVVQRLRERKYREEKPLAIMAPSIEAARKWCEVDALEARLLTSSEAPIVLLRRRATAGPAPSIAPGNPHLGVMLPYTPLHHLLLRELGCPVVATSGNLSDEPICIDEREALQRLAGLADVFLVHDRPIVRHVDDSIARMVLGREMLLRRARGYAPLPITVKGVPGNRCVLAVGGHLKNTVALGIGPQIFVSQHLGDLETEPAWQAFRRVVADLQQLYDARPDSAAADLHPDYLSTKFARSLNLPLVSVQHHQAHVLACMAENDLEPPLLGVSWDGTGFGTDGTIWGGEFFRLTPAGFERFAHLRPFPLPGSERAVKEPRRVALGLLYELFGETVFNRSELATLRAFRPEELKLIRQTLQRGINAPRTSSMGRLFDGVASLCGLRQTMRFEGQAAMELEFALASEKPVPAFPLPLVLRDPGPHWLDWAPLVEAILHQAGNAEVAAVSSAFHAALAEAIVQVAQAAGEERVVLTGGCFQNRALTERAVHRLQAAGFRPYWHQRIPPNDGGLAVGQCLAAMRERKT